MNTDLFRLAYCSRTLIPAQEEDHAELSRILAVSRVNNARAGVTGAILYNQGCFAQVLEGPLEAVQRTFERIQRDPRHGDVVVLQAERVATPLFSAWDMALAEASDPAAANATLAPAMADPSAGAGHDVVAMLAALVCREAAWRQGAGEHRAPIEA